MSEGLWVLAGVGVTGVVSIVTMVIRERYAAARQAEEIRAERHRRREEFWVSEMVSPLIGDMSETVRRLIDILLGYEWSFITEGGGPHLETMDEVRRLASGPYVPSKVRRAIFDWVHEMTHLVVALKTTGSLDRDRLHAIESLRFSIVVQCVDHLREAASGETAARFIDTLELPGFEPWDAVSNEAIFAGLREQFCAASNAASTDPQA